MKNISLLTIFSALILFLSGCNNNKPLKYPEAKRVDTIDTYFGHKVADPYRWLEDDNSEETKKWVTEENKVTENYLKKILFRKKIEKRLKQIWNYERRSAPWKDGGLYFYTKNNGLQNQSVFYMMKTLNSEPEIILDPNKLSKDGTVAVNAFAVSDDGKYLGYGISRGGSDWREFYIRNIETKTDLDDHLKWIKFSEISWYKDGFFYTRYPEPAKGDELKAANLNAKIYYHKTGTPQSEDELIYEDKKHPEWGFSAQVTDDNQFLIIYATKSTSGNALYYKRLGVKNAPLVKIIENFDNDYNVIDHRKGKFLILTNNKAPKYRLVSVDINTRNYDNWNDVIPESDTDVLMNVSVINNKLIANYQKDAHSQILVFDDNGKFLHDVKLPGPGTVYGFSGEKNDTVTFYTFSSYTYPNVIYRYNPDKNISKLYYKTNIDFSIDDYETKQVFYKSKDGTRIPMFIVHKKGLELNGNNPTWLYGYGGFNISLTPRFDVRRLVWLENGGVFAVANLRGGGEYGEIWHRSGTKMNKQNVFDDFIYAAKYLISNNYTNPDKLVIQGGSNGGLLIGAVVNQRPDLFRVALPAVGVMDMLRYQNFTIGRYWAADYGTSSDSEDMFKYLYSYSPLHNIKPDVEYPSVMVTTADHDDRVVPAHSFKYIATLQHTYKGKHPVLIRIETDAGHGAGKSMEKSIEEWADLYSFAFYELGIKPKY
ncbi:MAG: S9 family peptidase [Chlorobi bacterium]|nr:S9 family peptidase [Chlorobiota bacterium]